MRKSKQHVQDKVDAGSWSHLDERELILKFLRRKADLIGAWGYVMTADHIHSALDEIENDEHWLIQ